MLFPVASAEIQNNLAKPQDIQSVGTGVSFGLVQVTFSWLAVFVGILGVFILLSSLFLYLLAAGEEPKMQKAHNALWGGIFCVVGGAILYFIGEWLG